MKAAPLRFLCAALAIVYWNEWSLAQTQDQVISINQDPLRWTLNTANASMQILQGHDGDLVPGYFGPFAGDRPVVEPIPSEAETFGSLLREIPYRGGYQEMEPALEVIFPDHTRELELRYAGHELLQLEGFSTLRIDMRDSFYPFEVSQFIRPLPELDMFEKWLVVRNTGKERIILERASSGSVVLPRGTYDLMHLAGDWGREFLPQTTRLTSGLKSLNFHALSFSHQYPPFFAVRPAGESGENTGAVWFGSMSWTGAWRLDFHVNRMDRTQICGGINFWDTEWELKPGETFETPKLLLGVATDGANGASRRLHRYILDHVLPKSMNATVHKVLYNSWYATEFDVNVEQQVELAKIARDIGVELFAMDDGWFKERTNGHQALGDWIPDRKKFPEGLGPLISQVNALGMDFGLWVEPEMVSRNSDLYRQYPDWVLHTPHRTLHAPARGQFMLNLARDDVKQYLITMLDKLLSENDIRFIKWDSNRSASEVGWPDADPARQRELRIRYIRNLYEIFGTLRERHPNVVWESCSGGGGRVEPGILRYVDQIWTSDNTDAGDRLRIQYGFSYAFPAKVMVNWVTDSDWHKKTAPLSFKFHAAMAGVLGIGNDLLKWSEQERGLARDMVTQYKAVRPVIQLGDQYRLLSPFEGTRTAVQFVSRDGSSSVVFAWQTLETETMSPRYQVHSERLVLHGLQPEAEYVITGIDASVPITGFSLMNAGIRVPLNGNYSSRMVVLHKK